MVACTHVGQCIRDGAFIASVNHYSIWYALCSWIFFKAFMWSYDPCIFIKMSWVLSFTLILKKNVDSHFSSTETPIRQHGWTFRFRLQQVLPNYCGILTIADDTDEWIKIRETLHCPWHVLFSTWMHFHIVSGLYNRLCFDVSKVNVCRHAN